MPRNQTEKQKNTKRVLEIKPAPVAGVVETDMSVTMKIQIDSTIAEEKHDQQLKERLLMEHLESASIKWSSRSMKQEISQFRLFLHQQTLK
jgi:hypothetical protein